MKRLALGLVMSAALLLGSTLSGCASECDKQCDKFVQCWKDLSGGKLKKNKKQLRIGCMQQCKKDKARLKKDLDKICG